MRSPHHPSRDEIELTSVLHALSDPTRLAILDALADGHERSCGAFEFGMTKASMSHHFRVLREAGVTHTRLEGKHRYVALRHVDLDARFPGLLEPLLDAAQAGDPSLPPTASTATAGDPSP